MKDEKTKTMSASRASIRRTRTIIILVNTVHDLVITGVLLLTALCDYYFVMISEINK